MFTCTTLNFYKDTEEILQVPDQVEQIKYDVTNGFTFMYLEVSKCLALLFLLSIVMLIMHSLQKKRAQEKTNLFFLLNPLGGLAKIQNILDSVCNKPTITVLGRRAGTPDTQLTGCQKRLHQCKTLGT